MKTVFGFGWFISPGCTRPAADKQWGSVVSLAWRIRDPFSEVEPLTYTRGIASHPRQRTGACRLEAASCPMEACQRAQHLLWSSPMVGGALRSREAAVELRRNRPGALACLISEEREPPGSTCSCRRRPAIATCWDVWSCALRNTFHRRLRTLWPGRGAAGGPMRGHTRDPAGRRTATERAVSAASPGLRRRAPSIRGRRPARRSGVRLIALPSSSWSLAPCGGGAAAGATGRAPPQHGFRTGAAPRRQP
eukprot:scaffold382_cov380-Prasinococcus_capsulatus_cf.AAC.14